jgi:MYXO-CTERM domain-containing protein
MRRALAAAILLTASPAAAETVYVNAPLTSAPTGSGGVVAGSRGGSFGPDGWTTTGDDDAIWFLIPATLPTARIEVSAKGISSTNLDGEEHDLIVTYGDNDRTEPVEYMPAYRNNNFKTNLRVFGSASPGAGGRPGGANKLELRLCPAGFPGYSDSCPPGCTDVFEVGYLGGPPESIPWDPATNYRMKISWTPGSIKYTRGVEPEVNIGYPGTLAPKALRVRIGSPRHGVGSVNRMPKGITFSNLVIAGEPGTATPVCGGTVVSDAGVPPGCDATKPISAESLQMLPGGVARATYRHCAGAASLRIAQFWVGDVVDPIVPNLSGGYEGGKLFVGEQSCAPGEAKTLSGPHGSLDCARTIVKSEGDKLAIDWAITLESKGLGQLPRPFFVDAKGGSAMPEPRLGWTKIGTYGELPASAADAGVESSADAGKIDPPPRNSNLEGDEPGGGELPCSCSTPGRPARTTPLALAGLALLLLVSRKRG